MPIPAQPLIYLVDDDPDEHCLLQTLFSRHQLNYQLRCFGDGTELVTYLTHCLDGRLPNLILLDWNLPRLSGSQVLELLKQDRQWQHIPIIVRSDSERDHDIVSSYQLGAHAFICKGGDYQQLVNTINKLGRSSLQ